MSRDDGDALVASYYPVLLDPGADGLAVVTHLGRPDERRHDFGAREVLLIVQDPRSQQQVLDALRSAGPYANAPLADAMARALGRPDEA